MEGTIGAAAVLVLGVAVAALHQWLLDSPLFEPGAAPRLPSDAERRAPRVVRPALAGVLPGTAVVVAAVLVTTAPFRVWVWSVVGLLAATVTLFSTHPSSADRIARLRRRAV